MGVPHMMKALHEYHKPLTDPDAWAKLPQIIKDTPYFADGKLLITPMMKMMQKFFQVILLDEGRCSEKTNWTIVDVNLKRYMWDAMATKALGGFAADQHIREVDCRRLHLGSIDYIWTVTGWHRHVGQVADYVADPDLAGFSWKDGEAFTRPKQAFLMS